MVIETKQEKIPSYSVIDAIIYKHNIQPGAVIPILQEIQEEYGYVPGAALVRIASSLNIAVSEIYGIVTFYSQFRLQPAGKFLIKVCHGTACHLNGAERVASVLAQVTGAKEGETSSDNIFTVERVACLGCCSLAPCLSVNDEVHGRLSSEDVGKVLDQYQESPKAAAIE